MGFLDKVKDAAGKAAEQAKQAAATGKEKLDEARQKKHDEPSDLAPGAQAPPPSPPPSTPPSTPPPAPPPAPPA